MSPAAVELWSSSLHAGCAVWEAYTSCPHLLFTSFFALSSHFSPPSSNSLAFQISLPPPSSPLLLYSSQRNSNAPAAPSSPPPVYLPSPPFFFLTPGPPCLPVCVQQARCGSAMRHILISRQAGNHGHGRLAVCLCFCLACLQSGLEKWPCLHRW